ncbi:MAG TPA: SusD/RagB family nutrient-binding outer membrane lipoprotein [Saprospiraceae bacterium]|nr:SusD/RagB family nutrient-binding outer membrane lipoprotein [Saprospiraceae bacterium]HRO08437.1 SusD/RagB family nutrient-binding outer membrane lipoprotein [Saprospiraceae bacterium]HRP41822.1 SusD/RagB family nutrient-binding outer membrane lipoprotein [Saprospiraceae bacterium]
MKRYLIYLLLPVLFITSCVNSLDDYNVDTKKPSSVEAGPLFAFSSKAINDLLNSTNVNINVYRFYVQYFTSTTYLDEPRYDITTRTIPQASWDRMYVTALSNLKEAKRIVTADKVISAETKANQLAMIDVLEVYAYSILVNTFGDVPYTEALNIDNPQPKYDDAKTITLDLIKRLDADVAAINSAGSGFGSSDIIYKGSTDKWSKFANSLRLKLAMVIADTDSDTASKTAKAAAGGALITANADNALFGYVAAPNNNPVWDDIPPRSSRQDFVGASTFIDVLNGLNDPRRAAYYTSVDGEFKGGRYGFNNVYANFSTFSPKVGAFNFPGNMLDAAEVNFLLAEAVERGYISGNAQDYYNAGVKASIDYWGVSGSDTYLAQPGVDYANAASGATWREKIANQKWIAFYNRPFDAWTDWRKFDFPALTKPDAPNVPEIPVRLIYPVVNNALNAQATTDAATKIGGDKSSTKLFWDNK